MPFFNVSLAVARELEECVKNVPFFNVSLAGARECYRWGAGS